MSNCYYYRTFGLRLAVNRPISFLTETSSTSCDCRIQLHGNTEFTIPPAHAKHTTPICCEWLSDQGESIIRYIDPMTKGQMECTLQADGSRMDVRWSENVGEHDVIRVCTSVMMGRILHLKGKLALHANAVQLGESCILLAAPSGSGKSSTTAALLKAGAALLSDDITCIEDSNNRFMAAHGFAQLRLWPDTAALLLPEVTSMQRVYQHTALTGDKRYWNLAEQVGTFCARDLPVQAIYVLGQRHPSKMAAHPLPPGQAIGILLQHLYLGRPSHTDLWRPHFAKLVALLQRVPVFTLHPPEGLQQLHHVHDFFSSHLREQKA